MLPPFYYKGVSDEGLAASYSEVLQRVGDSELEVFLYHFPKLSGVPITHGLIELLLKAYPETIKGLKDSSGDAAGGPRHCDWKIRNGLAIPLCRDRVGSRVPWIASTGGTIGAMVGVASRIDWVRRR